MKKILSYLISPIHMFLFALLLLVFHPVQVVTRWIWGYPVRKKSVDILNLLLIRILHVLGTRISFRGFEKLPQGRPLIIVSNHQCTYDIPPIVWGFRKHHPKFISKIELSKGIPSISYNLRHGGSALIDRKNKGQAIKEIIKLGRHIEENNYAASIFPEGTRSKNGQVKKFQEGGIHTLLKVAPSSIIVPFVIDGNSELMKNGYYPFTFGVHLKYTVLDPIEPDGLSAAEIAEMCEIRIKKELGQG
ncbi:MAG: glycerol acyltransferase [Bacteroidetes bacterium GWF2_42_66]|nr:MAG: glycerol acyltransferase [Bacteroidetes bacterium GWA2_42_15]OFY00196.1 MAG: glycerol acyltransferase [Bacteroidetes bacterium GWE2_42_39]OFY40337.1 MAG: glycerol acyltransferase [Bacteroidetes bacterium GWF2_42_66]HBL73948.1 1-acyl-sn-glycerol-3-phosphate acyltransferase [Prolixibacteraceae bacterium]HCR89242.1 1-acyl-sn-glycerol-3-phosphate acyltransferase [Prolixibacteraceae bacterium]